MAAREDRRCWTTLGSPLTFFLPFALPLALPAAGGRCLEKKELSTLCQTSLSSAETAVWDLQSG
eukprot:5237498-Lingulodinium_polyedra.AAC.1